MATEAPTPAQIKETLELLSEKGKLTEEQLLKEAQLQERIAKAVGDVQEANKQKLIQNQQDLLLLEKIQEMAFNNKQLSDETIKSKQAALERLKETFGEIALDEANISAMQSETNEKLKISNNEGAKYRSSWESIATHVGMSNKGFAGLIQRSITLNEELADSAEKQKEFARAFQSVFNMTNAVAAVFTAFAESMAKNLLALDQTAAKFAAATGAGRGFTGVMEEAQANSRRFNVSLEEAGAATTALYNNFIGFNSANKDTKTGLIETTAQLSKFGIDAATATNVLNFFSANLGKSAEESKRLAKELAMMGTKVGISSARMTKDFQSALPTLAVYGDRAIDVFQGIAGSARLAGVETSKMLDLANKFDTFSSSAETAGKLNAILGTQISSMEMLNATESERIEMLIRSTQATGVAFKDLGRFEQKAVAAAAGISDLSEAQRIFGMDLAAFQKQQSTLDKSAAVQEEFNKALEDMIPLKEKFMSLFARFVPVVKPFLEGMHSVLKVATEFLDTFDPETLRMVGGAVMGLAGAFVAIKAVSAVSGIMSALAGGMQLLGAAGPVAGAGGKAAGKGFASFFSAIANPYVIGGIAAVTLAVMGLAYAYNLADENSTKGEEAKARQAEANVALAQSFNEIGHTLESLNTSTFDKPIAGLQLMAQALGKFKDVSVDARATLTNLALISAGKAADSANNARIVAAGATQISNNISNKFAPKLVLEVNGTQMDAYVKSVAIDASNRSSA